MDNDEIGEKVFKGGAIVVILVILIWLSRGAVVLRTIERWMSTW